MKKVFAWVLVLGIVFCAVPSKVYAGGVAEDSIIDKAGDWMATLGKSPEDKDMILAQRRAERAAKRMKDAMNKSADKAGKEMEKMGKDMKKMFN